MRQLTAASMLLAVLSLWGAPVVSVFVGRSLESEPARLLPQKRKAPLPVDADDAGFELGARLLSSTATLPPLSKGYVARPHAPESVCPSAECDFLCRSAKPSGSCRTN